MVKRKNRKILFKALTHQRVDLMLICQKLLLIYIATNQIQQASLSGRGIIQTQKNGSRVVKDYDPMYYGIDIARGMDCHAVIHSGNPCDEIPLGDLAETIAKEVWSCFHYCLRRYASLNGGRSVITINKVTELAKQLLGKTDSDISDRAKKIAQETSTQGLEEIYNESDYYHYFELIVL